MNKILKLCFIATLLLLQACNNNGSNTEESDLPKPNVSIVSPQIGNIEENIHLNGQVVYLNKTEITAPISGYVSEVKTKLGNWVKAKDVLFKIQTKESLALQNSNLSKSDEVGIIPVYATTAGYINSLNIPDAGVFINEGSLMASIASDNDLVIQVNAPYQYSQIIKDKKNIEIELPDYSKIIASFYKVIPMVDPVSQTQQIYFRLNNYTLLPENLNVIVIIPKEEKSNVTLLPKEAVLTNETQDDFWIMKVSSDTLAIKVPIKIGLESNGKVEIVEPKLNLSDKIIIDGAYGLPDSTKVKMN